MSGKMRTVYLDVVLESDERILDVVKEITAGTNIEGIVVGYGQGGWPLVSFVGPAKEIDQMQEKHFNPER